ncbi:DUF1330 domain-containing protein [Agarivorans aestuarii]|uniref:DUF1330 domain-containing protein n=1 Tax=Agarivorans aestuarii TaxID=1563703 RepID=A0ABU7G318_9ALTE|nr:DUF1330 domain-containing protein [Agarivorans aestuarii]MEE1673782.1 DUF1330 domain-containing protein [Agarivorans aestuarii]
MAAFLLGQVKIKNQELWQQYVKGVGESLAPYKAKVLLRGHWYKQLAGSSQFEQSVVIEFSSTEQLEHWYHSPTYQALIPLRDKAAEVHISSYSH